MSPEQLRWRCRRGIRELDVLFERFLAARFDELSKAQQMAFTQLLLEQDPIIMDWLFGKAAPQDQALQDIVALLRDQAGL